MNQFKTLLERQAITEQLIDQEIAKLKNQAYNPITGLSIVPIWPEENIEP